MQQTTVHDTRTFASINLELTIHDLSRVRKAAMQKAVSTGMSEDEWLIYRGNGEGRDGLKEDILMLLDPGVSPEGMSIEDSIVEVY